MPSIRTISTSGSIPSITQLALGDLAVNTFDGKAYLKKQQGNTQTIVEIGSGSTGTGGSGVTQIIAGTNISISPVGGTGAVTVNANNPVSASYALSSSYAANGGVTQLLAGANISLSPSNGLGQVTITSTGGSGGSGNTATGSYGSFYSTQTQTNVASTARSMSLNVTDISNGVSISGSTSPFNTYIKVENPGVYDIQFSAQVDKTDSGTDEIWIWIRKNGTDISDSATSIQLVGNGAHYVAAWNFFVNAAANDYFQLMWYSPDANVRLHAESAFGVVPGIPSLIVTANRVDQFLSNTGSFSGSFVGSFTGSLSGSAISALTASYVLPLTQSVFVSGSVNISDSPSSTLLKIDSPVSSSILFISGSGRIGMGTDNPLATLHIANSSSAAIRLQRVGSSAANFNITAGNSRLEFTGDASGARLTMFQSTKRVGINQQSPTAALHVVGEGTTSATTALLVQNANASSSLTVLDNGFVGIGTTTLSSSLHIKGSGNTFTSSAMLIQNSSNVDTFFVRDDGAARIGSGSFGHPSVIRFQVNSMLGAQILRLDPTQLYTPDNIGNLTANALTIAGGVGVTLNHGNGNGGVVTLGATTSNNFTVPISNTTRNGVAISRPVTPISGSTNLQFNSLIINNSIDYTFATSSIARGLYITPTLTAVPNFIAIETVVGNILFATTSGSVFIGTTSTGSGFKLDVSGSSRFLGNLVITGSATNSLLVKGSGTTSATTTLRVENANASASLSISDDNRVNITGNLVITGSTTTALVVRGSGSTAATNAVIFQNSAGTTLLSIRNDGFTSIGQNNQGLDTININVRGGANGYITSNGTAHAFGSNTTTPSAILEGVSTTKGFLPPRTNLLSNISNPAQGLITYLTGSTNEGLWYYNSGSQPGWQEVLTNTGSQSITGSITITGSLIATSITGSLQGTSSYALTASYASTANYAASTPVVPSTLFTQGYLLADQSIPNNIDTTINFERQFDPNLWLDLGTRRFTPTVAGYYSVSFGAWLENPASPTNQVNVQMRKSTSGGPPGTVMILQQPLNNGTGISLSGTRILYMDGALDYLDFTVFQGSGSPKNLLYGGTPDGAGTWFSAHLLTM